MINLPVAERESEEFVFFYNGICSQWFPCKFSDYSNTYKNAEQYMMYYKAIFFGDDEIAKKILKTSDPFVIKELGRQVKHFNDAKWDTVKQNIVYKGNLLKFSQNPILLKEILKFKHKRFVEASPYDTIWGIGLHFNDERCLYEELWQGENLLGKMIDKVVEELGGR